MYYAVFTLCRYLFYLLDFLVYQFHVCHKLININAIKIWALYCQYLVLAKMVYSDFSSKVQKDWKPLA